MRCLIRDLGSISTGNTPIKKELNFYDSNDIGFVKPDIISDSGITYIESTKEFISESARKKARIAPANSIFVTCIGNIGKIGISKGNEFAFNQQINVIEPNSKVIPEYLAYSLLYNKERLEDIANAPVVPIINKTQFESFEIGIEADVEIQAIVLQKLNKCTEIIRKRKQQLLELDTLIKARFIEMFGNPLLGTEKWPIHLLENVADSVDPQPSHRTPPIVEDGVPYISIKDCNYKTGIIDFEKARKVSETVLQEHLERYTLHEGDFIIGKIGTIGNPIFVPARDDYTLSANIVLIQPHIKVVSPYFLKYSFMSDFVDRQFAEAKNSTSQAAFGIQKVRSIKVMNPEISIQMEFEKFAKQIDKSKSVELN